MAKYDHQWLAEVADGNGKDLLRFLRARLRNDSDADDLAQEVYLRLLRVKDSTQIQNRRAYVLRVAANVANEWWLLARNRLDHSSEPLAAMSDGEDPVHEALIAQDMKRLETALETLSPKCQAVVLMHRRDQFTYKEIGSRLGISVSMVKKYLVRGLSICRDGLVAEEKVGVGHGK